MAAARFRDERFREKRLDGWRGGSSAGSAARRRASGACREQLVEGGGERRTSLPELFIALAQSLVRRQTRQESGSAAFTSSSLSISLR